MYKIRSVTDSPLSFGKFYSLNEITRILYELPYFVCVLLLLTLYQRS